MTPQADQVFHAIDLGLLHCASFLVPQKQRAEWRLEWGSELWHARRSVCASSRVSWRNERELARFCWGAFQDAACFRIFWWQERPRLAPLHGSAPQCLFWLGGIFLASYLISLLSPGVRAAQQFSSDPVRPGTILVQDGETENNSLPSMTIDQVRSWERSRQRYADGFAFYSIASEPVEFGRNVARTWRIAQASSNLFGVVGWPLHYTIPKENVRDNMARLVLSERMWRERFCANPEIAGRILFIGSRPAQIVGIAPGDAWRLPGNTDAWLLEPEAEVSRSSRGYVVAHLTRSGRSEIWAGFVRITSYDSQRSERVFVGRSLEEEMPSPRGVYWFGILLAFLALPAIVSVSLAEYSFSSHRPSRIRSTVRLSFLGMKVVLIMLIAYFSSVDLAYWNSLVFSPSGVYVQLIVCFCTCLFGMRWALLDQRQRCPVCLKRVTHPAQVGLLSRMFLAWNGTELICTGGHTLLHVPGLATSWFSAQRWMYLDSSWNFLFAASLSA
jgi:hypothetical protein